MHERIDNVPILSDKQRKHMSVDVALPHVGGRTTAGRPHAQRACAAPHPTAPTGGSALPGATPPGATATPVLASAVGVALARKRGPGLVAQALLMESRKSGRRDRQDVKKCLKQCLAMCYCTE